MKNSSIAIVGMSGIFPRAQSVEEYWSNIVNKIDCIYAIPETRKIDTDNYVRLTKRTSKNYSEQGYLEAIDKFDHNFFKTGKKEASLTDPRQRMFLEAAWNALEDAGLTKESLKGSDTGVYVGCNGEKSYLELIGHAQPNSLSTAYALNSVPMIPGRLSNLLDLHGPSLIVDTECSSSLAAVHLACEGLSDGECSIAVAAGIDITFEPLDSAPKLGIESTDGRTRAFDDNATGTGNGEGVIAVVLMPLEAALLQNIDIYAVILSSCLNNDGYTKVLTTPNSKAHTSVITKAWEKASVNPETITYIEAHGTGTKSGDPIEFLGIQEAFRSYTNKTDFCAISSVKSNIGHLNHASGLAGLVKAALAVKNKVIPPTLHFNTPNKQLDMANSPIYINTEAKPWNTDGFPRRCGVSCFGISGTNCHIVLEEPPEIIPAAYVSQNHSIFVLSAESENSLVSSVQKHISFIEKNPNTKLEDICFTVGVCRSHHQYRLAVIAGSVNEIYENLMEYVKNGDVGILGSPNIFSGYCPNDYCIPELNPKEFSGSTEYYSFEELKEICRLYVSGKNIKWRELFAGIRPRVLHLPGYSFEKVRCWVEIPEDCDKTLQQNPLQMIDVNASDEELLTAIESIARILRERNNKPDSGSCLCSSKITMEGRPDGNYSITEVKFAEVLSQTLGLTKVNIKSDLFELGINSITFSKLIIELEKCFNIAFEDEFLDFDAFSNLEHLLEYIDSKRGENS